MSFYLLHRGWMDNPIFKREPFCERMAWIWMIEQASYQPHKIRYGNKVIEVDRGQIPTSYRILRDIFRWGNQRIAAYLAVLEREGMLERKTGTGFLIITICNYEKYQKPLRMSGTQPGTPLGTDSGTQPGTQPGTNIIKGKEIKEKNNKKEKIYPEAFMEFFNTFPSQRKGSRQNALPAWERALNRAPEKEILNGLKAYIESPSVRDGFAKGAAAWLNDDGWTYQQFINHTKSLIKETRQGAATL